MASKKTTRRALTMSILSLLLCVSMLIGTTFAWFTDSVVTGQNLIQAGNLDVELYYGKNTDPTGEAKNTTKLFTDANDEEITWWEPGVVAYTNLKVANKGNLALKYQMALNFTNMNYVEYADGSRYTLADVLQVALIPGGVEGNSREDVLRVANAESAVSLQDFKKSGNLESNQNSDVFGLVVFWTDKNSDETDNLFNMNNGKTTSDGDPLHIDLGITLFATQLQYEEDSFGSDYDENIWQDAMFVASEEDLASAIAAGKDAIMLEDDIALTEALEIPEGATVAMNLNGKTLTGPGLDDEGNKVHALTNNGSLELVGGEVKSSGANGGSAIYNAAGASLTLEDVTVVGAPQDANNTTAWPSYAINNYGNLTVNSADITSDHGAISVYGDTVIYDANVTLNGRGGSSHVFYIGGEGTDLIVHGGTYTHKGNTDGSLAYIMTGTTMTVNGGTFTASNGGYGLAAYKGALTVNGGTFANAFQDWGGPISIAGGTFATKPADKYIAAGFKAVNVNGTYHVVPDDITLIYDTASLNAALVDGANKVQLLDGVYEADLYSISSRDSLTITGNGAGTKLNFKKGQVRTDLFKKLTIENCTIGKMVDKSWGQLVFSSSTVAGGVYTISNCILDGQATQGIYINQNNVDATYNILNCTFNGDFGNEGAITIQDNNCEFTVNVTDCEFNNIPETSHEIWAATSDPATKVEYGTWKLYVDGELVAVNAAQMANAVAGGATKVLLTAGEYKMPSSDTTGEVTITGTKDVVLDMTMGAYMENATVTIEGVTIKTGTGKVNGNGSDYAALYTPNVTYKDCTFVGPMRVGRDGAKFINCTFTELGNDYIWTYGNDVTFESCTFNTAGKAILIYSDGGNEVSKVSVKNCVFNSTQGAKAGAIANQNCAAIEIHNYGNGVDLTTSGNTFDSNFSGEWRIKTYENGRTKVFVNGTEYTTIALDGKTMTIDAEKNVTVNP